VLPFHFSCTIFSIQLVYDCYFSTKLFQRKLPNRWILFEHRSPGELEEHTHFDGGRGKAKSDEISRVNAWLVLGIFDGPYSGSSLRGGQFGGIPV
jgi:hypothetical protein